MPRFLILSASAGAGHMRAAQAVELALRESAPGAEVRNVDVLTLANAAFRRIYGKGYLDLVDRAPHILGYMYDALDKPPTTRARSASDRVRGIVDRLHMKKLMKLLADEPWDLAICTHFLPAEIIAVLRKRGKISLPQFTVTTDFDTHRLWVNLPCERFFTATEEGAAYLAHLGVPAADLRVTGIPVHPAFSRPVDRAEMLRRHGLATDRPVVLQLAGGFGVGPVEEIFRGIASIDVPLQIIAVAGRNETAKKRLESAAASPGPHRVKIFGFTDKMDELMAAADIVVSKPGGLTTSETLARGAAMVIVNPIPGQESRNSDYLLENCAAIKVNNVPTLGLKLGALIKDPSRLAAMRKNAKRLGHPRSAFDIADQALAFQPSRA
jgi:processive 1,2-diacylglycerol beta-glucosyltransferase